MRCVLPVCEAHAWMLIAHHFDIMVKEPGECLSIFAIQNCLAEKTRSAASKEQQREKYNEENVRDVACTASFGQHFGRGDMFTLHANAMCLLAEPFEISSSR